MDNKCKKCKKRTYVFSNRILRTRKLRYCPGCGIVYYNRDLQEFGK